MKIASTLFAALAQETRLAIYRLLVVQGQTGMAVGKIAEALNLAPATLSFHLKELSHAGLILARHEGRFIFYTANFAAMQSLIDFLKDDCCGGAACELSCASHPSGSQSSE